MTRSRNSKEVLETATVVMSLMLDFLVSESGLSVLGYAPSGTVGDEPRVTPKVEVGGEEVMAQERYKTALQLLLAAEAVRVKMRSRVGQQVMLALVRRLLVVVELGNRSRK